MKDGIKVPTYRILYDFFTQCPNDILKSLNIKYNNSTNSFIHFLINEN